MSTKVWHPCGRSVAIRAVVSLAILLAASAAQALPERASINALEALRRLTANAGGSMQHLRQAEDAYSMLRAPRGQTLMLDDGSSNPADRARYFLSLYGTAVGMSDPMVQTVLQRVAKDAAGNRHVHLDQVQNGLPVFGARVVVHMNAAGITGLSGVFVPNLETMSTTPLRDLDSLRAMAKATVAKEEPGRPLTIESGELVIYPVGLLLGRLRESRLAYAAVIRSGSDVRRQVFVDANTGTVLQNIDLVHHLRNREIYTPDQTNPPTYDEQASSVATPAGPADPPLVNDRGHGSTATSNFPHNAPVDNLWIFAGGTYALYKNLFGREGYDACDGNGPCQPATAPPSWTPTRGDVVGQLQKSVYLVNSACPNAYWNGDSTNYCPGFDADDVVSHEWSHAYTQFMHGLIYYYQSGALNESWSDIFGETYDLVDNLEGPLGSATLAENKYYEEGGSRWVVGEDLSEEAAALLLRDMWDPDAFPTPSPGKVTSANYDCSSSDNGGVHTNSGVSNHTYAMLVDGKTFNGVDIPAIGMIKAAHIYFQAESSYQTPTTQYPEHAAALEASCNDLIGVNLAGIVDGSPSGQIITAADCEAVHLATVATEMHSKPYQCNYTKVLQPEALTPSVCDGNPGTPVFSETWEGGAIPAGWTLGTLAGPTGIAWQNTKWTVSGSLPAPHTGKAAFAINPKIGEPGGGGSACDANQDVAGHFWLDSPAFTVGPLTTRLVFSHFMQSESPVTRGGAGADGGNLKYSRNNGTFAIVPAGAFRFNPHSGSLLPAAGTTPNTNPMAGEAAWFGVDQGEYHSQWGTSIIDFGALGAVAGDTLKFRWDFGQDSCNGDIGWFVDDVSVRTCPVPPVLALGSDYTNPDPDATYTLTWTRPAGAVGPDLIQESTTSCSGLVDDGAENGLGLWSATTQGTGAQNWQIVNNQKPQHAGNTFWATAQEAAANASALLTLKNAITLPAAGTDALTFEDWDVNEGDDNVYVEVSTNGTDWTQVYTHNRSALAPDGASAFGTEPMFSRSVDLTSYAGQSLKIRFRFTTGAENRAGSTPLGWYLDNISVKNSNWGDLLTTSDTSRTISVGSNGTRCYRVRTAFSVEGISVPSPFSNIVAAAVNAANFPPIARAGNDLEVNEGTVAQLNGTGSSDPDGDAFGYSWAQLPGGPTVTLAGANTATPSFTAPEVSGETPLTFRLTVSNAGGTTSDDVVVKVFDGAGAAANNRLGGSLALATLLPLGLVALRRRRPR